MYKKVKFIDIITGTTLSVLIFSLSLLLCYIITVKRHTNFEMGFPKVFYYQFQIDCEIQHGSDLKALLIDCLLFWILTLVPYTYIKSKKRGTYS
jgi:hypothetical protein